MAIIIEAPNHLSKDRNIKLFLAGSITGCPDWQQYVLEKIKDTKRLTIYNPRRKNFPIDDPNAAEAQIIWEFEYLNKADIVSFWFDKGSLAPITLLELGKYLLATKKTGFIGIDPEYKRKIDVEIQTRLARIDIPIVYSLDELSQLILYSINSRKLYYFFKTFRIF